MLLAGIIALLYSVDSDQDGFRRSNVFIFESRAMLSDDVGDQFYLQRQQFTIMVGIISVLTIAFVVLDDLIKVKINQLDVAFPPISFLVRGNKVLELIPPTFLAHVSLRKSIRTQ